MKYFLPIPLLFIMLCSCKSQKKQQPNIYENPQNLVSILNTVWEKEQFPIRRRDSLIKLYGTEAPAVKEQQLLYKRNHKSNEILITTLLDSIGWPDKAIIGEQGNWTICNVIQHSDNTIRMKYLPMMRQAVLNQNLAPRFLVRAEDRIATERGDLQIYGGQMKYYPETKSFNVWPVYDPINIDKRRAEIGLEPIATFLKNRFDFEWDLEEQIKRSEAFLKKSVVHRKNM